MNEEVIKVDVDPLLFLFGDAIAALEKLELTYKEDDEQ